MPSDRPGISGRARPSADRIGERELIERDSRAPRRRRPTGSLVDVGDDAAVYEPARNLVEVITTDAIVDGVHFDRRFVPPARDRPPRARRQPQRPRRDGRDAAAGDAVARAAAGSSPLADFDALIDGLLALAARVAHAHRRRQRHRAPAGRSWWTSRSIGARASAPGADPRRGSSGRLRLRQRHRSATAGPASTFAFVGMDAPSAASPGGTLPAA